MIYRLSLSVLQHCFSWHKVLSTKINNAPDFPTMQRLTFTDTCAMCKRCSLRLLDRKSRSPRDEQLTGQIQLAVITSANRFCAKAQKCFPGNKIRISCARFLRELFSWCQRFLAQSRWSWRKQCVRFPGDPSLSIIHPSLYSCSFSP